jgi:hypothetical protein
LKIRVKSLSLPDERLQGRYYELAQAIWHLKDRLKKFCRRSMTDFDIEGHAKQCSELLICADLANFKKHGDFKKHGEGRTRSDHNPRLTIIEFDTSKNGIVELHYNGATKEKELWVERAVPIPFRAPIVDSNDKVIFENLFPILVKALNHWKNPIQELGVLDSSNPECEILNRALFNKGA